MKAKMKEVLCQNCLELAIKGVFCADCFERISEELYQQEQAEIALSEPTPSDHIGYCDDF